MRVGDILLKAGLITQPQLDAALQQQKHSRQRVGQVLAASGVCTQEQIDQAWLAVIVKPALEAALDRASFNSFSRRADRKIVFTQAHRRTMVMEDLLSGAVELENEIAIDGVADVSFEGGQTITLKFTHDPMLSFAELQDDDDERIREWLGMGAASATVADRVAKAAALLRENKGSPSNAIMFEEPDAEPSGVRNAA